MATITQSKPEKLHESAYGLERVDRDQGRIFGVRVLGLKSKNGRRYLREAVTAAAPLYEGARVYLNHKPEGDRFTRERWGKLVNVRAAEDGGLIADLDYLKNHPETEATLEAIERFQDVGLSHDSMGRSRLEGGERVIYEIVKVNSVDLVENPATTENLWESTMSTKRVKFLQVLRENRAKVKLADTFLLRLKEMSDKEPKAMLEMGLDDMEVDMPMVGEPPAEETGDEAVKSALRQAVLAVFDGPDDSATTMKKIKLLMDVGDKLTAPAEPVAPPPSEEGDGEELPADIPESVKRLFGGLKNQVQKLEQTLESVAKREKEVASEKADMECRKLLESKGREISDERLRLLGTVEVGSRDALVESWPRAAVKPGVSRPRYSPADAAPSSYEEVRKSIPALAKRS
jgi:hypothetical protein